MLYFLKLLLLHEGLLLQLSQNSVTNACAELDSRQGMVEVLGRRARAGNEYDVGHGSHGVLKRAYESRITLFELSAFPQG